MSSDPLRIGLLLDSLIVPAWVAEVIRDIQTDPPSTISLVILEASAGAEPSLVPTNHTPGKTLKPPPTRLALATLLYDLYVKWDEWRVSISNDPLAPVNVTAELKSTPRLTLTSRSSGRVTTLEDPDIVKIREHNLDVILSLRSAGLDMRLGAAARYGLWYYEFGKKGGDRAGAYFWELYERNPVSVVALRVSDGIQRPRTIYESYSRTELGLSLKFARHNVYWKASTFVIRRLRTLHGSGWDRVASLDCYRREPQAQGRARGLPTNWEMTRFLTRALVRRARTAWDHRGRIERWFIALRTERSKFVAASDGLDLTGFQIVRSPRGYYYADPFVIKRNGQNYLFFEAFDYRLNKGAIACAEVTAEGNVGEPLLVLERPHHCSYPFVFEDQGEVYLIPETASTETVELYRAVEFPVKWELIKPLRTGIRAWDVTVAVHDGVYWFFAAVVDRGAASSDELFLFYADSLTGSWCPHPRNPIVSDVRRARSAGRFFIRNGKLIRPSQDCSRTYGWACHLNEVTCLTKFDYAESPIDTIFPTWAPGLTGTHTINSNDDVEVIDGKALLPARDVLL